MLIQAQQIVRTAELEHAKDDAGFRNHVVRHLGRLLGDAIITQHKPSWTSLDKVSPFDPDKQVHVCVDVYAEGEIVELLRRAEARAYTEGEKEGIKKGLDHAASKLAATFRKIINEP